MDVGPPIEQLHFEDAPNVDAVPGPKSRRLVRRQANLAGNTVKYPRNIPIAFEEGRGATLRDVDGNVYLDFFAGVGVVNAGHSNPYIVDAANAQSESLIQTLDFPSEPQLNLIERLTDIAPPGLRNHAKVVFGGPTGSNAVEATIKLAKYNTGGKGLIAFRGGYHGTTSGALSLTSSNGTKGDGRYTPLLPEVRHVPYPDPRHSDDSPETLVQRTLENVQELLEDPYSGLPEPAGIWIEPIQGEGGVVIPPNGFLPRLQEIANRNNVPLIMDEVQTGFGRTGTWFGSEQFDVTPDAMPMAKAISGSGFPLSATMYQTELDEWKPGAHTGTYRGFLPAMVAGVRAIEYIESHNLLSHARDLGVHIRERLRDEVGNRPEVFDIRGLGLFIGIELATEDGTQSAQLVREVQEYCYEHGVIVWTAGRHDSVIRLLPPLVMTKAQADKGMDVLVEAIRSCTR